MHKNTVIETFTLILQLGLVMIVSILFCTLAFAWIGDKTGISWLSVPGFFIGAIAGMRGVWRLVKKYTKRNDKYS